MKFVDEVLIYVKVGDGGNGFMSFCCEKFIEKGGFNGGDGGDGGFIYLEVDVNLNILVDYCYICCFDVQCGENGGSKDCIGVKGDDLILLVLVGIIVIDVNIQEIIGDLIEFGQWLMVVQGGWYGFGNICFKFSINWVLCQIILGKLGEVCDFKLELKVLVDVGLLGLLNVGKSIFICVVFVVKLKVVDYLFIILVLNFGVVSVGCYKSFVVVDIFGLIEGVVEGVGLGICFFKYLVWICIFLYLVDMVLLDESDLVDVVEVIVCELGCFSLVLIECECWLVLNKMDQIFDLVECEVCKQVVIEWLGWEGLVYVIFVLECDGIEVFSQDIMCYFDECILCLEEDLQYVEELVEFDWCIEDEVWVCLQVLDDVCVLWCLGLKNVGVVDDDDFDDEEDDGDGLEIFYVF